MKNINSVIWKQSLISAAASCGLSIEESGINAFSVYAAELIEANQKVNLTAITDPEKVAEKHLVDSIIPSKFIPQTASVLDIGTGGGFPGIPLKIFMPSLTVSLVDSSRKKINFLKYVIRILPLENINAFQSRAEDLARHPDYAGQFDVVISRAFTALDRFFTMAVPLIKDDGCIIAMKGKEIEKEIDSLDLISPLSNVVQIDDASLEFLLEKYRLPVSGDDRSLVIARFCHP